MIRNGVLEQTSVSQVEVFLNCALAWWFERVFFLRPDMSASAIAGDAGHALLATHLRGQQIPTRAKMLKVINGVIAKGELPKAGPDLLVELRGDGQEKFSPYTCECRHPNSAHTDDGKGKCSEPGCECTEQKPLWIPLNKATTLSIGGVPFDLFIDLTYRRGDRPVVLDHKFKSKELMGVPPSSGGPKHGHELILTVQMPVYVLAMMRRWPDAREWEIAHHYVSRSASPPESLFRRAVVTVDEVREREASIADTVKQMKVVAGAPDQDAVPFNRRWCEKGPIGLGCPHQSICRPFKEKRVELTEEEKKLFGQLDAMGGDTGAKPAEPESEEAKAEREFKERMAKIAADKKAKADLEAKAKADAEAKAAAGAGKTPDPIPDPAATGEQPAPGTAKGKGKQPPSPAAIATVTLTVPLATFDKIRPYL